MYIEIKENSNRDLKRINIILEFFFKRTFYFAPSLGHFFGMVQAPFIRFS